MITFSKIENQDEKSVITNYVLRELPDWFGIEESIIEYVEGVKLTDFYAIYDNQNPIGFISIKIHNLFTAEIYVIGILKEYQDKHLGQNLLEIVEKDLIACNIKFLMVKTLGESHPDINYMKTRRFYERVGFYPLEEIKEIWGEANPCLIMIKGL